MPELPEVETIRLGLEKYVVGHKIEDVEVRLPKMFQGDPKAIIGAKVIEIRRFGKGLVIDLSNKKSLAIHIKLTGQLIYQDPEVSKVSEVSREKVGMVPNKFTHVIFKLDKDAILYYNDQRRFGWIKVVPTDKVGDLSYFKGIGPEPQLKGMPDVSEVSGVSKGKLTFEKFKARVSISHLTIKPLIMDQKKIGGIGNIYANDALFLSGIDPRRKGHSLSEDEVKKLYKAIHSVMEKGFKYGGASELTFVNVLGQEGEYQRHSLVYGKKGQKCPNCGGEIEKIFLGGRGTFFCPACQK
ncbi:MAG: bifunctional DNA-formamidopyrimidine glycosylase/DNA-(apurinic or apyrimidinic site) lyase [Candidatus Levybacteria bacterium]|nr:bifunctional DNA-formamidopyrimidine glycosylase/DNA-(apurinic or apyrimidinic site) lyase [Candidatus Levybacteria bacterium]